MTAFIKRLLLQESIVITDDFALYFLKADSLSLLRAPIGALVTAHLVVQPSCATFGATSGATKRTTTGSATRATVRAIRRTTNYAASGSSKREAIGATIEQLGETLFSH